MGMFDEVEFAALCDPMKEERRATGEEFSISARFADMDEMLGSTQLDAALVATPPELNAPAARHAWNEAFTPCSKSRLG